MGLEAGAFAIFSKAILRGNQVKHANRSASPQTDASGRATATITIRPRASGSRYAPTATYSQRPSKLLAVDRCAPVAGVDPQRWPRAFVMVAVGRARTASAPLPPQRSFGVVPRPPIEAALTNAVGPSSSGGRGHSDAAAPPPNPAHGAAALRTQPRIKPRAAPRRPAHPPSPARRSQR